MAESHKFSVGETALVCHQSWAGAGRTPVEIIKIMPKRVRVRWLVGKFGRSAGAISDVPKWALQKSEGEAGHAE